MLGDYPLEVVLLATDMEAMKAFYGEQVGLKVVNNTPGAVTFKCGGDTRLVVSKSTTGTKDDQTQGRFESRMSTPR